MKFTINHTNFHFSQNYFASVNMVVGKSSGDWLRISILIGKTQVPALVDNGSSISFITIQLVKELDLVPISRTNLELETIHGVRSSLTNIYEIPIDIPDCGSKSRLLLHEVSKLPEGYRIMLGKDAISSLNARIELVIDTPNDLVTISKEKRREGFLLEKKFKRNRKKCLHQENQPSKQ